MTNTPFRGALAAALLASTTFLAACGGTGSDRAAGHTSSSAGLPTGSVEAGAQLAERKGAATGQSCVDCHGAGGNAPIDPTYPRLGGQYRDYLAHAIQMYRDGERAHALMGQQAASLTDQEIADLAAYFAAQPSSLVDLSQVTL